MVEKYGVHGKRLLPDEFATLVKELVLARPRLSAGSFVRGAVPRCRRGGWL